MADLELSFMPAARLAALIRAGEVSPREVVANSLERIGEIQPQLNCFCFTYPEEAMELAARAEKAVMDGEETGPLHGVPIAFKDLTPTRGKTTTLGSHIFADWVPDHDAVVVERLLGAGAIMVGKTTTPEFAAMGFTESRLWGQTRNPWNPARTPGGSSGGSAVAVATGCVPLAEGSDMGGSVRIPAAFCGITGLKAAFGRIPFDIWPSQFDSHCHIGPLARTVDDAALFLDVAHGPDDRDIMSLPGRLDIPAPMPAEVAGLRIGLTRDLGYYAVDPDVVANLEKAADALAGQGAEMVEVDIPWTREVNDVGINHFNGYIAAYLGKYVEEWGEKMHPSLLEMIELGRQMTAVEHMELEFRRTAMWDLFRPVFDRVDALVCPTMSIPAPDSGVTDLDFLEDDEEGRCRMYEMTFPFNVLGPCPALSIPSGLARDGLPTATQIVGRRYDELTVLRIGAALEASGTTDIGHPPV